MVENHCIFCRIIAGEAPAHVIHEDELTLTFLDLFPTAPGHSLIVTRNHHDDIFTASEGEIARVAGNAVPLAHAIRRVTGADALGVHQLNGAAAGQTVYHYHMHLIPQFEGRTLQIHGRAQGSDEELRAMAERLRRELAAVKSAE